MTARTLPPIDHRRHCARDRHDHVAHFIATHVVEDRLVVGRVRAVDRDDAHRASWPSGRTEARPAAACPGGRLGITAERQRIDLGQGPVGIDVALEIVADDAGADDRPRLLPRRAVGLAGPALHAVA